MSGFSQTRHVLIAGFSARAAAESAARAGFDVTAADAFTDLDQHPGVRAIPLREASGVECDAVVYLANFENRPRAVETLAIGRTLWGNPPAVLRRVRDPLLLLDSLRRRGFATPHTAADHKGPPRMWLGEGVPLTCGAGLNGPRCLMKPVRSGGGHGIRPFDGELPRGYYVQEHIEGTPGSIVFAAAGRRAVPLGITRQLVGDEAFGASGFQYCGNLLGPSLFDAAVEDSAIRLAAAVTEEFGLVGVNGLDFIARDGVAYPIEVNPRWCASMELVERACGVSVFDAHAAACRDGRLPENAASAMQRSSVLGKAIVFARKDVCMGDTRPWLDDPTVRDVPHPGQRIRAGNPICTVFASGGDADACRAALVHRAHLV